jgi:hypothetical protein
MTSWRAKVDAVTVSPSGHASRSNTWATVPLDTRKSWSGPRVRPDTARTKVSGPWPRSAASVRHRPYKVSAASWSLGLRVAWTAHLTSRGVRSRPEASSRSTSSSI